MYIPSSQPALRDFFISISVCYVSYSSFLFVFIPFHSKMLCHISFFSCLSTIIVCLASYTNFVRLSHSSVTNAYFLHSRVLCVPIPSFVCLSGLHACTIQYNTYAAPLRCVLTSFVMYVSHSNVFIPIIKCPPLRSAPSVVF